MKKYLQGIPVTKFLLFSFITLSILLVVTKYSEYQRISHAQSTLNELIVKSVRRQQILTSILKGSDYARVNILNILLHPGDIRNSLAENNIYKQVLRNNKDHEEYKALIEGSQEQELYANVTRLRGLNSESRQNVIQLIKEGAYSRALIMDQVEQSKYYDAFQQANVALEEFVIRRDRTKIQNAQSELIRIKKLSNWSNIILLLLLIGLGIIISRTIRILRDKNRKLAESERAFRNLFDLAPIPMWVIDIDSLKFMLVNKAAVLHYGYNEEEFLAKTILDIRPKEEANRVLEDIMNGIEETNQGPRNSKVKKGIYQHLKKSHELIDVEIYNTPFILDKKKDLLSIAIDVTERNRNEQRITKAIINAQEQERYEIGGELHDNVCQILAASKMNLTILKSSLNPEGFGLYDKTKASILLATDEIRNLSHRLAPAFFDTNLKNAFESLLMSFNMEKKYETLLFFDKNLEKVVLNRDVQLNLYRIMQEQLKNIFKYANGSIIEIDILLHNEYLKVRIADNGVGFDMGEVKSGIGLANMKRRAELFSGRIHIDSSPGSGCEVIVTIPVAEIT